MGTTVLKIANLSITKILQSSHAIHCCATDDRICMQLSTPPTTPTLTTKTNSHNDHNTHKAQQHRLFPQMSQLMHNVAQTMISVVWAMLCTSWLVCGNRWCCWALCVLWSSWESVFVVGVGRKRWWAVLTVVCRSDHQWHGNG